MQNVVIHEGGFILSLSKSCDLHLHTVITETGAAALNLSSHCKMQRFFKGGAFLSNFVTLQKRNARSSMLHIHSCLSKHLHPAS